jgi:DNA repair exonuclease SbcCD ATPase subunit
MAKDANTTLQHEVTSLEPKLLEELDSTSTRRETLHKRVEEDKGLALTRAEFQDMLKDLDTLYKETLELITKIKDLRAYSENYCEQLQEAKHALSRNETILDRVLTQHPHEHTLVGSLALESG